MAAILLFVVAGTGVILQVQKLTGADTEADSGDNDRADGGFTTAIPSPTYAVLISRTLDAARARAPNSAIASVSLRQKGDRLEGVVMLPGEPPRELVIDARSGRLLSDERRDPDSLIKRIHSGAIFGQPGVVLGILWGTSLLVLVVTGGWVYLDMYRKRRRARGKGQVFW